MKSQVLHTVRYFCWGFQGNSTLITQGAAFMSVSLIKICYILHSCTKEKSEGTYSEIMAFEEGADNREGESF